MFDAAQAADKPALMADKEAFLAAYPLDAEARAAFIEPGWRRLLDLGVLPNLVFKLYMMHGLAPDQFAETIDG